MKPQLSDSLSSSPTSKSSNSRYAKKKVRIIKKIRTESGAWNLSPSRLSMGDTSGIGEMVPITSNGGMGKRDTANWQEEHQARLLNLSAVSEMRS